jgi:hypothetical protein
MAASARGPGFVGEPGFSLMLTVTRQPPQGS